jgi:glycosyltransferase involved in cell wall biosynthesis
LINTEHPIARILWEQTAQPFHLAATHFDLVHQIAFVAPLILPRPCVVMVHDLTFIRYPERLSRSRRLYLRTFTRLSCARAKRVLANSQSTANDLSQLLGIPPERIDLAIPGVEPRFQPLPREQIEAFRVAKALPPRFLLFVGTIEPRKNLKMLLHAYAALPLADREAVHLVLAGGMGWLSDDLPALIDALNLTQTVHLPGYIPDPDLPLWYNACEAFVYPSVFEGWGLPVTEALACGKLVITSSVSSLPEAVGQAGVTLPPDQPAQWTEALRRAIHDPGWRADYGAQGLAHVRQFTWRSTAEHTLQSYHRALHSTR